jgi:hypothetical protein
VQPHRLTRQLFDLYKAERHKFAQHVVALHVQTERQDRMSRRPAGYTVAEHIAAEYIEAAHIEAARLAVAHIARHMRNSDPKMPRSETVVQIDRPFRP